MRERIKGFRPVFKTPRGGPAAKFPRSRRTRGCAPRRRGSDARARRGPSSDPPRCRRAAIPPMSDRMPHRRIVSAKRGAVLIGRRAGNPCGSRSPRADEQIRISARRPARRHGPDAGTGRGPPDLRPPDHVGRLTHPTRQTSPTRSIRVIEQVAMENAKAFSGARSKAVARAARIVPPCAKTTRSRPG